MGTVPNQKRSVKLFDHAVPGTERRNLHRDSQSFVRAEIRYDMGGMSPLLDASKPRGYYLVVQAVTMTVDSVVGEPGFESITYGDGTYRKDFIQAAERFSAMDLTRLANDSRILDRAKEIEPFIAAKEKALIDRRRAQEVGMVKAIPGIRTHRADMATFEGGR